MPKFNFQARDPNGKTVAGVLEAQNLGEVRTLLRGQNLSPITIKQQSSILEISLGSAASAKDLQVFSRQFAVLIEAGVPIIESLQSIAEGIANRRFKAALLDIIRQISTGKKLSEAMAIYPLIFDRLYINLIKAGEEAGVLDEVLNRLAFYIEKSNNLKSKITGALWYPVATLLIAFGAIAVILIFVIPKFQELFSSQGQELPALTQMVVNLSEAVKANWYYGLGVIVGVPIVLILYYRTPGGRSVIDTILVRVPIFGQLIIKSCIAKMSRTLSTLLKAGVQLVDAVEIAANVTGNAVIERDLKKAKDSIVQGREFVEPLKKSRVIPLMVSQMIGIGEKTGNMDVMLTKVADFYETEVETAADALTSLIEPLLIVFLGGAVGFLVISMFLPIFNMAGAVGG